MCKLKEDGSPYLTNWKEIQLLEDKRPETSIDDKGLEKKQTVEINYRWKSLQRPLGETFMQSKV